MPPVRLGQLGLLLPARLEPFEHPFPLGVEHVRRPLQEQHPEDVFLELGGVHLALQDVRRGEQAAL